MTNTSKLERAEKERQVQPVEMAADLPEFAPATDIYEKADSLLVKCDMPGVLRDHVDITLEDDVLTLTGRQESAEPEGFELLYRGYASGVFRRSFTLGTEIDRAGIKAKLNNGVLEIVLPKAERVRPRKIAIDSGE